MDVVKYNYSTIEIEVSLAPAGTDTPIPNYRDGIVIDHQSDREGNKTGR